VRQSFLREPGVLTQRTDCYAKRLVVVCAHRRQGSHALRPRSMRCSVPCFGVLRYGVVRCFAARDAASEGMTTVYDPERVVVEEVLWRANGRRRTDLYNALPMLSREEVDRAIVSLTDHGLVRSTPTRVLPTASLRHIESLNLIAV
jgi:hypothetical protein